MGRASYHALPDWHPPAPLAGTSRDHRERESFRIAAGIADLANGESSMQRSASRRVQPVSLRVVTNSSQGDGEEPPRGVE